MNQSDILFGVDEIARIGEIVRVRGRCYQGPIVRADRFTMAFVPIRTYNDKGFDEVRTEEQKVHLEVVSILAYQKEIPECSQGMTAELHLAGYGEVGVGERYVLLGLRRDCERRGDA